MKNRKDQSKISNPFVDIYPSLDLHGEITSTLPFIINDFINDNVKMKKEFIIIIHGIGSGKVKQATYEILSKNKQVLSYKLDIFNPGVTKIKLKIDK